MNRIVCGVPPPTFGLAGPCKARRIRSIGLNRGEGRQLWGLNGVVVPSVSFARAEGGRNDTVRRVGAMRSEDRRHRRWPLPVAGGEFERIVAGHLRGAAPCSAFSADAVVATQGGLM